MYEHPYASTSLPLIPPFFCNNSQIYFVDLMNHLFLLCSALSCSKVPDYIYLFSDLSFVVSQTPVEQPYMVSYPKEILQISRKQHI